MGEKADKWDIVISVFIFASFVILTACMWIMNDRIISLEAKNNGLSRGADTMSRRLSDLEMRLYETDLRVFVINNLINDLSDCDMGSIQAFLQDDPTDSLDGSNVDLAVHLVTGATRSSIRSGFAMVTTDTGPMIYVAFNTSNWGMVFVDPAFDYVYFPDVLGSSNVRYVWM